MPLAVCATPIGNLEDVTLRVLRELAEADVVLCEDTRHSKGLLDRHGIQAKLLSYHRHNEAARTAELLPRLEAGERIALVSDAGLPGVNDPGARLIRAALEAGLPVTVLPGPSAVETALVASGLAGERFQFLGYLPRGEKALAALWDELGCFGASRGRVRVAAAAAGDAPLARRGAAGPRRRRLPRADEAVRGGRPRAGARGRAAVRRGAEGRGHARLRRGAGAGRAARRRATPSRRSASSSRRGCPGARRPTWSPGSREFPVTLSMRNR